MKTVLRTLISSGAFLAAGLFVHAQDIKIATVDLEKVFNTHYETIAEQAKLKSANDKARTDMEGLAKDRNDLIDQYKALDEQTKSPVATADAKAKAQSDAQAKLQQIQAKNQELQKFVQDAQQSLGQQWNNFRAVLVDDISKKATNIAKAKGATLLIDKSAPGMTGTQVLLYSDPGFDITQELVDQIAKDKPADMPAAPAASAPAASAPATSAAPSGSAPTFSVPNVTPNK